MTRRARQIPRDGEMEWRTPFQVRNVLRCGIAAKTAEFCRGRFSVMHYSPKVFSASGIPFAFTSHVLFFDAHSASIRTDRAAPRDRCIRRVALLRDRTLTMTSLVGRGTTCCDRMEFRYLVRFVFSCTSPPSFLRESDFLSKGSVSTRNELCRINP